MLRHYFVIAIRNLKRSLNYSLINIGGLAIGLASFLFIVTYINDELRYDRFHENASRIYRVNRFYNSNEVHEDAATCSFPFGPALKLDYPEIVEEVCRFFNFQTPKYFFEYRKDSSHVVKFNERSFFLVDSTVFDIFTLPFIKGDPISALNRPFEYSFLNQDLNNLYKDEDKFGRFSVMLTFLALFIASLGLFELVAYLAERKTKEIGVRKAMGAKIADIIILLSKEFIWLIVFANIVAWPVAAIVANDWLENFTKSINLSAWLFIISGAGTLLIAILITIYRAYRASVSNPATILRYE